VTTSRPNARSWHALALCVVVGLGLQESALGEPQANPQPTATASSDAQNPAPKGGFFSTLKQAFNQDFDHEVVRGHFDVGSAPDVHRYYCLVDPKTGKREPNGVAGQPFVRPDGMTGIKSGAVSFESCAGAEQQGTLVTQGYTLIGAAAGTAAAAPAPRAAPATPVAPVAPIAPVAPAAPVAPTAPSTAIAPAAAAAPVAAPSPAPAPQSAATAEDGARSAIMALFARFIDGQNAHDAAAVAETLLDSKDFVWAQARGNSIWGRSEAMRAFQSEWKGTWKMEPQLAEARVAGVAAETAVLVTPLLFTEGSPGKAASTQPIRWSGVFVRTDSGWRISSIFITPYPGWIAPRGP
jgi:ketosteroid isomerase-like protein